MDKVTVAPPEIMNRWYLYLHYLQASSRKGCSSRVYHIDIKRTNPGFISLSKAPNRTRFVAKPAKFVQAGVLIRSAPQQITVMERNLPIGNF